MTCRPGPILQLLRCAIAGGTCATLLAACSIGPRPQAPIGVWDFGPPSASPARLSIKALGTVEVVAPRWIDSVNTHYRLGYANPAQPMAYSQTRWVMPPPILIDARLRERLVAGGALLGGAGPALRIELDEFAQTFDSDKSSRAVLRARATLSSGREVLRQRPFVIEVAAPTADGPGGAAALARAADRLIEAVLDWAGGA